uniref:E3 UFM1-protein ligase 1 homolog n=1 Tax=Rhabditophanes sp. KR3021 TaxID=114890 RepID=A0AC35TUT0_9BILA
MSATWADIQKLASALQKAQNISGEKKLSDNNVIEILSTLRANKVIDIIFTANGKEYVTRKHLRREVANECLDKKGRVSFDDMVLGLNVDYSHIVEAVKNLCEEDDSFITHGAELYTKDYMDDLCRKIEEKLNEKGRTTIFEITKSFDLPTIIIDTYIISQIGFKINALKDGESIYTRKFLDTQKKIIKGAVGALTKVCVMEQIAESLEVSRNVFVTLWNELEQEKVITGRIMGSKSILKQAYYIPIYFIKLSEQFIRNKFNSDGFIDMSCFKKLFMLDVNGALVGIFGKEKVKKMVFLNSIVLEKEKFDEFLVNLKDDVRLKEYCNVLDCFNETSNVALDKQDLEVIKEKYIKGNDEFEYVSVDDETLIIYSKELSSKIYEALEPIVKEKARKEAPNLVIQLKEQSSKKAKVSDDEDDDWNTNKGGKGKKKVNTKKSSTKKGKAASNDFETTASIPLPREELLKTATKLNIAPRDVIEMLFDKLSNKLEIIFQHEIEITVTDLSQSFIQDKKKIRREFEEKAQSLYNSLMTFYDGTKVIEEKNEFASNKLCESLKEYLFKSIGTDLFNTLLKILSDQPIEDNLVGLKRDKAIKELSVPEDIKGMFTKLYQLLNSNSYEDFLSTMDSMFASNSSGLKIKFPKDSVKKEFQNSYLANLKEQLNLSTDHATSLLLSIIILLNVRCGIAIHASGKLVSALLTYLNSSTKLNEAESSLLLSAQAAVIEVFKSKGSTSLQLSEQLNEAMEEIKKITNE